MPTKQLGVRGPPHMLNNPCIVPWHISTGNPNLAQSLQVEMQPRKDEPARPLFRAIHSSDKLSINRHKARQKLKFPPPVCLPRKRKKKKKKLAKE